MAERTKGLFTRCLSASELVHRLLKVAAENWGDTNLTLSVDTHIPDIGTTSTCAANKLADQDNIKTFLAETSDKAHLLAWIGKLMVSGNPFVEYVCDDAAIAQVQIRNIAETGQRLRLLNILEKHFEFAPKTNLLSTVSDESQSALAAHNMAFAELRDATAKLTAFQAAFAIREAEHREKLISESDAAYRKRTEEADKRIQEKEDAFEAKRNAVEEAYAAKVRQHEDLVKTFETRDPKWVRRDLLTKIQAELNKVKTIKLSGDTIKKRATIHLASCIMLVATASLAITMGYRIFSGTAQWPQIASMSAGVFGFVCTMVYYLKWNDLWFREHADAEFAAMRYQVDILRASWLAELIQEIAKEGERELPSDLVAAYTRSLFRDVGPSRVSEHPFDQLTGLMKRLTGVKINKTGIELQGSNPEKTPDK